MKADGVRSATRPRNLARMLLLKGDEVQARELFRIALDNAIYLGSPLWTFETLLVIADYLKTKVDFLSSVQLLAACFRLLTQLQEPATWLETDAADLRAALGTAGFDEQWAHGKALSVAAAIGLAQQRIEELSAS